MRYRGGFFSPTADGATACERSAGGQPGAYGRIVRIALHEHDRRIFTLTPYGSPSWKRGHRRRSALERINSRLDHRYEFEQHFIRGLVRMQTRVGAVLAVMMALALGHWLSFRGTVLTAGWADLDGLPHIWPSL